MFDDTQVKEIGDEQLVTRAAYLLFYQRKSIHSTTVHNHNWIYSLAKQMNYKPPTQINRSHDALLDGNT